VQAVEPVTDDTTAPELDWSEFKACQACPLTAVLVEPVRAADTAPVLV
jgi:hypothetical protein